MIYPPDVNTERARTRVSQKCYCIERLVWTEMKKKTGRQRIIILLIGIIVLLSCHTHAHHLPWDGDDAHCHLCQILSNGFTGIHFFDLIILWILIGMICVSHAVAAKTRPQTGYDNRASPDAFLCR